MILNVFLGGWLNSKHWKNMSIWDNEDKGLHKENDHKKSQAFLIKNPRRISMGGFSLGELTNQKLFWDMLSSLQASVSFV